MVEVIYDTEKAGSAVTESRILLFIYILKCYEAILKVHFRMFGLELVETYIWLFNTLVLS